MKSFVKILCGLSILGFATVACNKEVETQTPAASKHSVKVTAGISSDTRTEMLPSGNQTKWTDEDVANMHFFENGIAPAEGDLDVELNADKTQLTIMAEFANTSATQFVYTSILASNLVEIDENKNAILDDEQFILDGTFDPLADILVAKPEERDAKQNLVEFSMQYKRVVAVNKIKIKGLEAGDKIESVTISSNKPILGSYSMTNDAWTNSGYELTLDAYDEIEVSSTGEVSLYFITAPVENALLSLYVETDNHKYEKDFTKTITFAANTVTSFATTVAESEIEEHEGTGNYVRVESTSDLAEGEYVLVTEATGKVLSSITTSGTNKYGVGTNVSINNHTIASEVGSSYAITLAQATITSGAYTMNFRNSGYLYALNSNSLNQKASNAEEDATTNFYITIANGNASIKSVTQATRSLVWNAASSGQRFAFYKDVNPDDSGNSQHNVQLYKKDVGGSTKTPLAKPVVSIERNATLDGIIVSWNDVNKAANYTVTCTRRESQTIAQGVQTAEFTNLEPGTYAVTVTANPVNADRNTATTSDEASIEILDYQLVAPTLSFTAGEDNIVAVWTAVPNAASYTYTVLGPDDAVVVEETNTEALTFTASNLTENTTYTFKIKSIGEAPYVSSEYSVQTCKTNKAAITTIAGIKAEITATASASANAFTATLTNAVVTSKSGNYAFIQDASGAMCLYRCSGDLAVGDVINGEVSGKGYIYNLLKEISVFDYSEATITHGGSVVIPELTFAQLMANYSNYEYMKVKLIRAHVSNAVDTSESDASGEFTDGTNTLALYATGADRALPEDAVVSVLGHPSYFNNAKQFASYDEGNSDEILYYIPTITTSNVIEGVPAAGVTNEQHDITITNDSGWSISVSTTGCVSAASLNETHTKIIYSVSENTSETEPGVGTIVVALSHENESNVVKTINVSQLRKGGVHEPTTATLTLSSTKKFGTTSGSTLSDDMGNTWTCTGANIQNSYQSAYSGQQFGTGSTNNVYSFTTTVAGKTITGVSVTAAAGGTAAKYTIKVNGSIWKSGNLSKTPTTYSATGSASGEIEIILDQNSGGKAVYLGEIVITYN